MWYEWCVQGSHATTPRAEDVARSWHGTECGSGHVCPSISNCSWFISVEKEQRPVVNCTIIISSSTSCCSFLLPVAISNHLCSGKHLPSYRWKQQQRVGGINCVKSPLDHEQGGERIECKSPVARKSASTSKGVLAKLLYAWCTSLNKLWRADKCTLNCYQMQW